MGVVRERPILFSGPMVRAILAGQKTVTRRVVTPQPEMRPASGLACAGWAWDGPRLALSSFLTEAAFTKAMLPGCPYGAPGDRLWVRETWSLEACGDGEFEVTFQAGGTRVVRLRDSSAAAALRLFDTQRGDYRPSIHMPRWASRLTLEVVSVRVERLQEITNADSLSEGVMAWAAEQETPVRDLTCSDARLGFLQAWDTINGKRPGCAWADNPWVWRVEFRRVEPAS